MPLSYSTMQNTTYIIGAGLTTMGLGAMIFPRPFAKLFGLPDDERSGFVAPLGARDFAFGGLTLYLTYLGRPKDAALAILFLSFAPIIDGISTMKQGIPIFSLVHWGGAAVGAAISYSIVSV